MVVVGKLERDTRGRKGGEKWGLRGLGRTGDPVVNLSRVDNFYGPNGRLSRGEEPSSKG